MYFEFNYICYLFIFIFLTKEKLHILMQQRVDIVVTQVF